MFFNAWITWIDYYICQNMQQNMAWKTVSNKKNALDQTFMMNKLQVS